MNVSNNVDYRKGKGEKIWQAEKKENRFTLHPFEFFIDFTNLRRN